MYAEITTNAGHLRSQIATNRNATTSFLHLVDDPEQFLQQVLTKRNTAYVAKMFAGILSQYTPCEELERERTQILNSLLKTIYCHAIGEVSVSIEHYKHRNSLIAFDDMIVNLHRAAVRNNNTALLEQLQQKYRAVFVDEFQDTDKLQFEIFQTVFSTPKNILFYIGDPKQSIYSWRKADIFTYFKASETVDNLYSMNVNFRSSAVYIRAINFFFKPTADFDTFFFKGQQHAIEYVSVEAPKDKSKGELLFYDHTAVPITIFESKNKNEITDTVTAQIITLLEGEPYILAHKGQQRRVKPSDIGILVRTNNEAMLIKNCLAKKGIPAVTIDNTKILQTEEAVYVLYLLEALLDLNRAAVNKALLSPFTGYDRPAILALDEESVLNTFRSYKALWDKDGVYSVLMRFVADYQITTLLLHHRQQNGERKVANLFHIIEVLHKVQSFRSFSAAELVNWLRRGIDGMITEGDEFEQRVESDEEAVKDRDPAQKQGA